MSKKGELQRRLNVIWVNWTETKCPAEKAAFRYIPRAIPNRTSEFGWQVFDRRANKFMTNEQIVKLSFTECSEMLAN